MGSQFGVTKADLLIEANKRGLLTGDKKAAFDEAMSRGLFGGAPEDDAPTIGPVTEGELQDPDLPTIGPVIEGELPPDQLVAGNVIPGLEEEDQFPEQIPEDLTDEEVEAIRQSGGSVISAPEEMSMLDFVKETSAKTPTEAILMSSPLTSLFTSTGRQNTFGALDSLSAIFEEATALLPQSQRDASLQNILKSATGKRESDPTRALENLFGQESQTRSPEPERTLLGELNRTDDMSEEELKEIVLDPDRAVRDGLVFDISGKSSLPKQIISSVINPFELIAGGVIGKGLKNVGKGAKLADEAVDVAEEGLTIAQKKLTSLTKEEATAGVSGKSTSLTEKIRSGFRTVFDPVKKAFKRIDDTFATSIRTRLKSLGDDGDLLANKVDEMEEIVEKM